LSAQDLESRLRHASTPVIGRVEHGVVLLDLRAMLPGDHEVIMAALEEVLADVNK
jgi:seryl-tRNA(Sec) selenium transferase